MGLLHPVFVVQGKPAYLFLQPNFLKVHSRPFRINISDEFAFGASVLKVKVNVTIIDTKKIRC